MIHVSHLTRRFGAFTAVEDVSFRLEKGEVVGFLGPNGAGKTTTMRMLTGFLPVTSGSIEIAGFDVLRQSLEVRKRIGYLPEAVPLYREHRVEEMLLFQGRLHGLSRKESRSRGAAVLDRVGLGDRARSLVGKLSKGMRQRVGLAVALLPDPDVLILDEPTSGLDPLQRIEVRGLLTELARERTVLLSSHILPEIEAICPRVIILHKGRMVADGSKEELVTSLGGETHVRLEAFVGPDSAAAATLLGSLPGVERVETKDKLGIHQGFEIYGEGDLREDVGALAMQQGWALRELTFERMTLERIFARIAFEMDPEDLATPGSTPVAFDAPGAGAAPEVGLSVELPMSQPAAAPAAAEASRQIYSLNPFDGGATRDLSAPTEVQGGPERLGRGELGGASGTEDCAPPEDPSA